MPLVAKLWKQYGLQKWDVTEYTQGPNGVSPQYGVKAVLTFETAEGFLKSFGGEEAKEVLGDIPNFSKEKPVIMAGNVVGSETL